MFSLDEKWFESKARREVRKKYFSQLLEFRGNTQLHSRLLYEASNDPAVRKLKLSNGKTVVRVGDAWAIRTITYFWYQDLHNSYYAWSKGSMWFKDCLASLSEIDRCIDRVSLRSIFNNNIVIEKYVAILEEYVGE